jgi:dTDP-4-dehydrorhamnose reductase
VTGARGTLGRAIARVAHERGLAVVALSRGELDVCHRRAVTDALDAHRPWAVVNAAGFVDVDRAERDRAACMRANGEAAAILAEACAARGIRFATYSSDLVFDGSKRSPYVERDPPAPINTYGASKVVAERLVLERNEDALVARTSAFFGPWDEANFVHVALEALQAGKAFRAATDAVVSPTFVPHLAAATLTLIIDGARGIWHLATPGEISWFELARRAAALARIPTARLVPCAVAELGLAARRPAYGALASERAALLAPLDAALPEFVSAWVARSSDRAPALGEANVG